MLSKQEVINTLNKIRNEDNDIYVQKYIDSIISMDDTTLESKLKELKITRPGHIIRLIKSKERENKNPKFIALNDLISYGKNGNTIHIHVVPSDVHSMMNTRGVIQAELKVIDAVEQIKSMIQADKKHKNVKKVYAVSPIIASMVAKIFNNLDFEVKSMEFEKAKHDEELKGFYHRFKGKNTGKAYKYLGRAQLGVDKLLSEEWEILKDQRKQKLETTLEKLDRKKERSSVVGNLEKNVEKEPTPLEIKLVSNKEIKSQEVKAKIDDKTI